MSSTSKNSSDNGSPNGEPLSLEEVRGPRQRSLIIAWCLLALSACVCFVLLGNWQLDRRVWKLALIERAESRAHVAAVAAPPPAEWPTVTAISHEYLHVAIEGRYLHDAVTFVQASTGLGVGFWALVPLQQADGSLVLINRGFVEKKDAYRAEPASPVHLTGLLRLSEPGGSRGRKNEPENERWFSRDIQAMAQARGLPAAQFAPYFIDVDYNPASGNAEPVGGLTVISFYNHHLAYALTWYTLALMVAAALAYLLREERKKYKS